jgi:hypothetical protein
MPNVHFKFNLTITQGDDRPLEFVFDDEAGAPVDISANDYFYTAKPLASLETDTADAAAVLKLEPTDFTKSDSGSGTTDKLTATLSVPATLAAGTYQQDLQKKDASGNIVTIGRGQLVVEAQVTQRTA